MYILAHAWVFLLLFESFIKGQYISHQEKPKNGIKMHCMISCTRLSQTLLGLSGKAESRKIKDSQ